MGIVYYSRIIDFEGVKMVFEPNFTKVVSSARNNVGITQSVVEVKLPTNDNTISNIYSVSARSTILNKENVDRDVSFSGVVDVQAVYESNGEVNSINFSAEFRDKYLVDEVVNGELILTSNVVDVNSSVVPGGIRVVVVVETLIDVIASNDINVLTSVNGDNVHISTKTIEYSTYIGKGYEKFEINDEYQLKDSRKILSVLPCVSLLKVDPKENFISIVGRVNVDICYQNGDNINNIATQQFGTDFTWEVSIAGVEDDSTVQSVCSILFNEMKITSTSTEEGVSLVNFYMPIVYEGYVFNESKLDVIDDLYSQDNYLSVTSENITTLDGQGYLSIRDNISGSITIGENAPFIDDVIGVCAKNIVLASSKIYDDLLVLEGIANVSVMYYTKETNAITSITVEMPFSIEEKVDARGSAVVSLCLVDVSARSKRGKEIEVLGELNVFVDMYSHSNINVISDVALGDVKLEDDCSLYIYIVKPEQTLWDIAKDMNISQDEILEQNPDIALPVKAGDKLVIYKQHIAKM